MIKITNILYPLDLDSKDFSNVNTAIEFTKSYNAVLHFLFVNDETAGYRHPTDYEDAVALKLKQEVPAELLDSVKIIYAVSRGILEDEVKDYCSANSIDLIITSHRQHSRLYTSLFDTPDENILDSVKIPVLILPKK